MSENDDCPLCLEPYHPVDHLIPVPCPNRACHFNFCLQCINKLIASSKDAPGMASDGNIAIKVKQVRMKKCTRGINGGVSKLL